MDPSHKRKTRLIVTLGIALLLATALIYTSFSASTVARTPSQLLNSATPGETYELTGRVVKGSVVEKGKDLSFKVADRAGTTSISVKYSGTVPDPFREGREVILEGEVVKGTFIADPGSLITKCPSKFSNKNKSE
ncbi:MAG: cytochrome c maturation protein CcmE [Solirubrobacterales bacterium]